MHLSSRILKNVEVSSNLQEIEIRHEFNENHENTGSLAEKIKKVKLESNRIINETNEQKNRIIAEAEEEKEIIIKEALEKGYTAGKVSGHKEGYEAGYNAAYKKGQKEIDDLIIKKNDVLTELQYLYDKLYKEAEEKLVNLSLAIAERVLHQKLSQEKELFFNIAKDALQEVHAGESYFLFVNPEELGRTEELKEKFMTFIPLGATIQILPDAEISIGGCKVENESGYSEGTIESQFDKIKEILLGAINNAN